MADGVDSNGADWDPPQSDGAAIWPDCRTRLGEWTAVECIPIGIIVVELWGVGSFDVPRGCGPCGTRKKGASG
jgi:hypothetical protein